MAHRMFEGWDNFHLIIGPSAAALIRRLPSFAEPPGAPAPIALSSPAALASRTVTVELIAALVAAGRGRRNGARWPVTSLDKQSLVH